MTAEISTVVNSSAHQSETRHKWKDHNSYNALYHKMWRRFSKLNQSNVHGIALIFYQSRHFVERWRMFFNRIISSTRIHATLATRLVRETNKKRSWHPHSFSSFFIGFLWCGRLFWLSVVCTFAFFVVQISYGQWVRYQQHPTMISLETNYGNWMYLYPAVTMCSNYTNADTTIDVVQRWVWTTAEQNVIYFFVTPERQTDVRKKKFDEMHPTTCSCTVCGTFQPTTMHLPCTKRSRSPLQPPPGRI